MRMDEENKLIAQTIRWVCGCISVCFLSLSGCGANSDYQNRLVAVAAFTNAQDPVAVGCALGKVSPNSDICQLHAVAKR